MTPISTVTIYVALHPWCHDERRDEAVRAAEDGRPGPLLTLDECIGMLPKIGSATSGVKHENKGERMTKSDDQAEASERAAPNGLRTERVTLELPPTTKQATVEDAFAKAAPAGMTATRVTLELPPTPEPSEARVTLEFYGCLRAPPSQWPWDLILSGACIVRSEPGEFFRVVDRDITDDEIRLTVERDAAIRERDKLRTRVAELEADVVRLRRAPAASGGVLDSEEVFQRLHNWRQSAANEDGDRPGLDDLIGTEDLEDLVDHVCDVTQSAPAASGGGEGEPVAWGVLFHRESRVFCVPFSVREAADHFVGLNDEPTMSVVPLHYAPPQPRGWLTGEERKAIQYVSATHVSWSNDDQPLKVINAFLARSLPPEVVLPRKVGMSLSFPPHLYRDDELHAALAAAGVAWKTKA